LKSLKTIEERQVDFLKITDRIASARQNPEIQQAPSPQERPYSPYVEAGRQGAVTRGPRGNYQAFNLLVKAEINKLQTERAKRN